MTNKKAPIWRVIKKSGVNKLAKLIPKNMKDSKLISGGWDKKYALGVVVIDHVKGRGEVHEEIRDIWCILFGKGKITLGGKMYNSRPSRSLRKGEWSAEKIIGGNTLGIGPGDIIDIPPGVPHQLNASTGRIIAILVKMSV